MIKYSKQFMEKHGKDVHKSKLEIGFVKKWLYWIINSKYRTSVRLSKWLKQQVDDASIELFTLAQSLKCDTNDETIISVLTHVHKYLTYASDQDVWAMPEYWQKAQTSMNFKTGDCEDFSVLIYVLARLAGIPEYQLTIACGTAFGGGHAYCVYSADCDGIDRIIDGCYCYTNKSMADREYAYSNTVMYVKEWFRFNESNSYIKKKMED